MMTRNDLVNAWMAVAHQVDDTAELKRLMGIPGTRANLISRAFKLYNRSHEASTKFGYVGVGCITFAEHRVNNFCRRLDRRLVGV